jgi:hypothetical protein
LFAGNCLLETGSLVVNYHNVYLPGLSVQHEEQLEICHSSWLFLQQLPSRNEI